jgi:hypothetical protein
MKTLGTKCNLSEGKEIPMYLELWKPEGCVMPRVSSSIGKGFVTGTSRVSLEAQIKVCHRTI